MKRVVPTPRGPALLDVAGSQRHVFVTVTLFGDDGWASHEEMWGSPQSETLAMLLTRMTEMPLPEADAVASEFLATWRDRGGADKGATVARRFGFGVAGVLVAVALVAVLLTLGLLAVFG
jgi:hypothetical protein